MVEFLLEARGVEKRFGEVRANRGVNLAVRPGEVHALIGENGSGKSTLINILCGAIKADGGEVRWRGEPVRLSSPAAARRRGIGAVFQHFALFASLSGAENIALGLDEWTPPEKLAPRLRELGERYGLALSPHLAAGALSAGEKQRLEILRCLLQEPQLMILDEPTSVLTPVETEKLFVLLRRLADEGRAVLFISHKLDEVESLCDQATVLRRGETVGCCQPKNTPREKLVEMMVGHDLEARDFHSDSNAAANKVRLEIKGLRKSEGAPVSVGELKLRAGVITGVAGIAGNGQESLLDCISGEISTRADCVILDGEAIGALGVRARRRRGLLATPTDRHDRAVASELSLQDNTFIGAADARTFLRRRLLDGGRLRKFAEKVIGEFDVVAEGAAARAGSLSGGNLQKYIMGRAILQKPQVLAAANPTWGVDVRSAQFIHRQLADLRASGAAVLLISEDLDELLTLCDEIAVINNGALDAPQMDFDRARVGARMTQGRSDAAH